MNKTKLNGKPRYAHNCQNCTFLGHTVIEGKHFDIYQHTGKFPTFLARYGKADESYLSFPDPAVIAESIADTPPKK